MKWAGTPGVFFVVNSYQVSIMRIQLSGVTISYDDSGARPPTSRPTILFIHGYPLSRKLWKPQMSDLAGSARLLLPDLRGFGESDATPGPYSMELLADDCLTFLDWLGIIESVILCGLSMGGYIALSLYRKYPQRVKGLILAATRAAADSLEAKTNRDKAIALAEKEGAEAIDRLMLPKMLSSRTYHSRPETVEFVHSILLSASVPGITGALAGMRDRPDSTSLLAQIAVPTLLIFGEEDQFVPRSEVEAMRDSIKDARLHWIPDAGHLPNLEQPAMFNSLVQEYLVAFTEHR
jgi:3-oxoadipate enol-lactonase